MFNKFNYKLFDVAPILPQVYDETLSFYECLCRIARRIDYVTKGVNENFIVLASRTLDKYFKDYVESHITYTPDDKGLHLISSGVRISGNHQYIPETNTMKIVTEDDLILECEDKDNESPIR